MTMSPPVSHPPAVILAAGRGNRLLPLTADRPKCMLEIGGRPIVLHQIDALLAAGVERIEIVTGHGAPLVERTCRSAFAGPVADGLRFAHNADYDTTTSLWSLGCTTWPVDPGGLLILNSDVLFDAALIGLLLADPREQVLLAEFSVALGEEEMKIQTEGGQATGRTGDRIRAISKTLDPPSAHAENLGVLKVGPVAGARMLEAARDPAAHHHGLCWVPDAIHRLLDEIPFHALATGGLPWIEIDYEHDLARARDEVWPRIARRVESAGS
jgi:choline kinase